MNIDAASVRAALDRATELLSTAEDELASGRDFSLDEFNTILGAACQTIVLLPREQFQDMRGRLQDLVRRLESMRRNLGPADAGDAQA